MIKAASALDKVKTANADQKAGVDIVRRALETPIRTIANNAGVDGSVIVGKIKEGKSASEVMMRKPISLWTCLKQELSTLLKL